MSSLLVQTYSQVSVSLSTSEEFLTVCSDKVKPMQLSCEVTGDISLVWRINIRGTNNTVVLSSSDRNSTIDVQHNYRNIGTIKLLNGSSPLFSSFDHIPYPENLPATVTCLSFSNPSVNKSTTFVLKGIIVFVW